MPWNEEAGHVTRAFDEWKGTAADIRTFLDLTERWSTAAYEATWAEAQSEFSAAFDPDRHDPDGHVDLFEEKVSGLWDKDYLWMVRSAALRDMVTAFEVYAEKSLVEALTRHRFATNAGATVRLGLRVNPGHESPAWPTLVKVHGAFGNTLNTTSVAYIRSLRHVLTHQRGQLRTADQRAMFEGEGDANDWRVGEARVGGDVPLSRPRVERMMEQLNEATRSLDPAVWESAWQGKCPDAVAALANQRNGPLTQELV